MKRKKVLALLLSFTLIFAFNGTVTQSSNSDAAESSKLLLYDDFNNAVALDGTSSNALGGHYWGNGLAECKNSILNLKGTSWLDSTFKDDESPVDLSMYSHLVYIIKSDSTANMNDIKLSYKDASGTSVDTASVNITVSSDWATIKIPLSKFTGVDLTKVTKLKADSISGMIYIDKIYFEYDSRHASNPDIVTITTETNATEANTTEANTTETNTTEANTTEANTAQANTAETKTIVTNTTETIPAWTEHNLTYSAPPVTNPLKGFIPYSNPNDDGFTSDSKAQTYDQLPYSMEWFYLPLNTVMKGSNNFDWTTFEARLNDIASRGHQAVLRFYVDYPDKPCGIPQYLLDEGLLTHSYVDFNNGIHATSLSPDYNDPRMLKALTNFIKAFGAKYDGDPRIGFITEGLVGFWGEWHTWPHDGYTPSTGDLTKEKEVYTDPNDGTVRLTDWMPTSANQDKILVAYDNAFNITKLQLRQPMGTNGHSVDLDMGYHDDSFAYETLSPDYDAVTGQTWMFWGRMEAAGATDSWKTNPMGGEMRPEIQSTMFNYNPPMYHQDNPLLTSGGQDFYTSLNLTHATWLLSQVLFTSPLSEVAKARVIEADSEMGYVFYVPKSYVNKDIKSGKDLSVGIELDNLGVAPFYYKWKVEIGLKNSAGKLVKTWSTDWDISNILPDDHKILTWTTANNGIKKKGKYTVVMRVVNPLEDLKISKGKAAKLLFANVDQNKDGWLALSTIIIISGE